MALPLSSTLEAILFAAGEPISKKRLMSLLDAKADVLTDAINVIRISLEGRGLALIETDEEVELRTAPGAAEAIKKLRESELSRDLGKASLETLAFILYKGAATRGEIDWVRGVNSAAAVRALTLRGLIERSEDPTDKRRARFKPTIDALAHLGVTKADELPRYTEFAAALSAEEAKAAIATEDLS
ncbi:MAG: scpB [Parcubacteria group bacterium]|nr:scpB [Parcubacteria group bacterium]